MNLSAGLETLEYVPNDLDAILIMTVNPGYAAQELVPATWEKVSNAKRMKKNWEKHINRSGRGCKSFEDAKMMRAVCTGIFVANTFSIFFNNEPQYCPI